MDNLKNCPAFIADVLRQCKTNPDRIAIIDAEDRKSSYADFLDIIERTAGFIKAEGIPEESFILINLPNSMEYLAIEFGIWASGCAIVPVNPFYPKARIDFISSHCDSPLIIDEHVLEKIKASQRLEICNATADIAALFYTSGSTGAPKGVIHTFESLSHIDSFSDYVDVRPDDVFATAAPFSFIAWILILPFLRAGACVNLIPHDTARDMRKLQAFYDKNDLTCAIITPPSTLKQLNLKENKSLRVVLTGSERVTGLKSESGYRLINLYGQTETALTALYFDVDKAYDNTPVGKPVSDFEMKLMDDGEICLRGILTPGYFKDPERSAALWSGGWLHTGDIGRMLPDGNVEYVNRKDWMVKINGQRVETGEIACVIKEMEGVSDAVAKGFTAADGHQYVVAYYIADETVTDNSIREYLSKKLAPYMIPSAFVRMKAFPTNFNGKVDVKSLQSPQELSQTEERDIIAPQTEEEKILCKGFESALGISPISVEDDFFSLGGDSIRVMQLQVACPQLDLSSSMIYTHRTARAIAKALQDEAGADSASHTEASASDDAVSSFPLSKTQSGIFVECMARRGEAAYNNPNLFRFLDPVDAEKLAEACTEAVKAHPNVFATIEMDENGLPLQRRNSAKDFKVEVETVTDAEFDSIRTGLFKPFDILGERLFRMKIYKTETKVWLFTDFHHIIFDGTSNGILMQDIETLYAGGTIKPESYTGFDLARDEEKQRNSAFLEKCRKWNLDTFCEADQTSLPDPDRFNDTIAYDKFEISTGISAEAFSKAAESLGVTENVLSTGAFGYMLGACSHSTAAAFATVYNGRKSLKTARTMSMMVKTLPVYCSWNRDTLVGDYFKAVKEQLTGAMAHDLFSFAEICSATSYDSRVIFTYQDELLERRSLCGSKCSMISLLDNATGEPLAVQLFKEGGSLVIRTEYRSNMYSENYLCQFISCYINILSSLLLAGKDTAAAKLNLVSEAEKKEILELGWGKPLEYDKADTVVKMIRRNAAVRPDATAVVDENGNISYAELDKKSDRLASLLVREGVAPEDFVALILPRQNCYPISFLACFKCGAAYVPMDYEYPIDRLQYMIENSEAKVLLTTHEIYEKKSAEGELKAPKIIFVDDPDDGVEVIEGIDKTRPEGLAYMIYTSGTTGRPKGVMIEHRSLTNLVKWYTQMSQCTPDTRMAEHASFSFDGSIPDLMVPLCCGGQLHILPSGMRKDLAQMYRYFCENKIDGVLLTTQLGQTMLKMYDLKLKFLVLGGEKMSGKFHTKVRLINGYGPTEFTIASSYYQIDTDNIPDNIPIGQAVPNTFSGIVDSCGRLLPKGVAGELVLAGVQLARGYWHRDDTTAERFVPCPFIPGEKMYRTGDLVKWSDDGQLLYLGRIDSQIKLRGFRIELGEIESNLAKFEGIKSAVVAVKEIAGMQHLCAYYCADKEYNPEELRKFQAASLTDYMVPTAYVRMEAMPMTPNGKVDIKKLPVPEIKAEEIVKPSTELETKIFGIVADFLKTDDFGVNTNLISMGMTSLGAITISLLLSKQASLELPSSKILEMPTIRQWAEFLGEDNAQKASVSSYEKLDYYSLTENQTGIYIDWENHRESLQYNVPMLLRFSSADPQAVADAVKSFVEAHSYLKTHFQTIDGEVRQLRCDDAPVEVNVHKLDKAPSRDFFQKQLKAFDLFTGPLYRFDVFSFEDSTWLLSDIHHIVFDGGSEAIFAKEIADCLNGAQPVPETFSAFDYSLYYKKWQTSEEFGKSEQYFKSLLEGTVSANLPSSQSDKTSDCGLGSFSVEVPRKEIRACCQSAGVTENALVLTAVTQVLHRFTRENNISILTVSSGRSLRELERSCGMFVQTLPVVSHHSERSIAESLSMMHSQAVNTLANDKYPYTKIVESTGLKSSIIVAYQGDVLGGAPVVNGKEVEMSGLSLDTVKMPVSINVTPGPETVNIAFEYDRAKYCEADVTVFALALKDFIRNLVAASPEAGIGTISCTSADAASEIVAIGRGPAVEVPGETIVGLFRKNVEAFPDDVAVVDQSGSITYAQLDKASDILACTLLASGLRKEEFVGLMLPRCKEFSVAYMAVFKSGGAYVPMDYEYPIERLQYMLEDSRSHFLVTTHEILERKSREGELKADNIIFIDDIDLNRSDAAPTDNSRPDGLAYMIYTSGTTGKPKGVMLEHHSIMNMMAWYGKLSGYGRGVRSVEHASFSFDASVLEITTTLAYGGQLHILGEEARKDPEVLYKYLVDNKIEVMTASTQLGMMMLNSYKLPIRSIMLGGEKLTGKYDPAITVINGYGPTEFTVCSSYHIVDSEKDGDNIPIGIAVGNTISAIVDPCGCLLPRGVAGELVLIGPQLSRGYWNREETTAQRFVPCPFIPGERMYRTGDLARWSPEGELLFMGRIDTQVKLRGFRIELGEIESTMTSFDSVTAAVAQVKEISGTQHLCGYFTASSKVDLAALKAHLSATLTSYMVPDALMQLDEFPLTANGKVDLKKLPLPELSGASHDAFEAPDGELEQAIAGAFGKVLGLDSPISRNSSFFLLGGTSLLVMKVIVMLSEQGHTVTYSDVFKYPTPRALAAFLDGYESGLRSSAPASQPTVTLSEEIKPDWSRGEDGYDYTAINKVLETNSIADIDSLEGLVANPLGDILLLGSTGYLGIHILQNILTKTESKVYCVIRGKKGITCAGRLKSYLMYYFDNTFSEFLDKRLFVIEGDMTDDGVLAELLKIKVDTVINCAANVKHFAAGDEIEKINLNGTEKLIDYCLKTGSRLIHTSTHSISGQTQDSKPHIMMESELYFGQIMMTKYQTSKFQAERAILEACATKGLKAKIMRLGNLMPRFSDGEFQINIENNGFMSRMRAYYLIGCIAAPHLHSPIEFAPIDETADAILTLARTPDKFTVFHPFNNHNVYIDDIVAVMRKCGLEIKVTDTDTFNAELDRCLKDDRLNPFITTLLAYGSHDNYVSNQPSLDFTVNVLNAMDWRWPITGTRYLRDAFEKMIGLEYFEK